MWLKLYKLNNCFNDKRNIHLGLRYKNKWYAITHFNTQRGVKIPKYFLKMWIKSDKDEFLKRLSNTAPNILEETNMKIHSRVLEYYDKYKLDSLKNKIKRYNEDGKQKS